jgi:hypothetical protein
MENVLNLSTDQCAEISALAGIFDYDAKSKMAGKKYRRFKYNGKAFAVEADHEFCKFYDLETLAEAKLLLVPDENDATITRLQLDCCKSQQKVLNLIDFKREKEVRSKIDYTPQKVSDSLINAIS